MEPYGFIYLTTRYENDVPVRFYLGQRKFQNNYKDAWYMGSGIQLHRAIKKYGREAFKKEILEYCHSREEMDLAEIKWIEYYDAVRSAKFYNISEGGKSAAHVKGKRKIYQYELSGKYIRSFDSIVEAALSVSGDESFVRASCSGRKGNTAYGFQWRIKYVPKLKSVKRFTTTKNVQYKPVKDVMCYDLDGNYINTFGVREAVKFAGLASDSLIYACCLGTNKYAKGYQWRNVGHTDKVGKVSYADPKDKNMKAVFQCDPVTGNVVAEHASLSKAALSLGCSVSMINASLKLNMRAGGFFWRYAGTLHEIPTQPKLHKTRPVDCLSLDGTFIKRYAKMQDAAKAFGLSSANIHKVCSGKGKTSAGHRWRYAS